MKPTILTVNSINRKSLVELVAERDKILSEKPESIIDNINKKKRLNEINKKILEIDPIKR